MLPKLPYQSTKRARDTVAFLGLNRTEATQDGELRDAQNLSTAEYPTLTTRGKRTAVTGYTDPTDLFEWDGHVVVVDGSVLKYDGNPIDNVLPGKKQFAVVNTKLCIFPDKVYIDLTNNSFGHLDAEAKTLGSAGSVAFTSNSITASILPIITRDVTDHTFAGDCLAWNPAIWTYGTDRAALEACWVNGAWDDEALGELATLRGIMNRSYGGVASDRLAWTGDIFLPQKTGNIYTYAFADVQNGDPPPDPDDHNDEGYYAILTVADPGTWATGPDASSCRVRWHFDVYQCGIETPVFSGVFRVGDAVTVSGTPEGLLDKKQVVIRDINDYTNTLTFDDDTFIVPVGYGTLTADWGAGYHYLKYTYNGTDYYYRFKLESTDRPYRAGDVLYITSTRDKVYVVRSGAMFTTHSIESVQSGSSALVLQTYDPALVQITIKREVPDLDFICAKDNRLWGVSNDQENEAYNPQTGQIETFTSRVIYASALGDPCNWWVFQGVDTDSYQVAVGSEGDFTAITPLDGVCCWKENRLHKILGSYPSEYYMTEYRIDGVAAGCERSCTIVNETLYYVGRNGVFAYSGGVPVNVGYALGEAPKNAVGGTNGRRWYLSGQRGAAWELLTYDLTHRLWMREDATRAEAFANVAGTLYMLAGGTIYMTEQGADAGVQWLAEFAPYWEMGGGKRIASTTLRRRYYLRALLRLEMSAGSAITVQVKCDSDDWKTLLSADTAVAAIKEIAIPPKRCDKMILRLSGSGVVKLRDMAREYVVGSERP